MSIAAAIRRMLEAGLTIEQALIAAEAIEQEIKPARTARQERNRRYYEKKASEKRLNKTEQDVSDGENLSPEKRSPTPPKKLTPINPPSPPKGGSSPTDFDHSEALEAYHATAGRCGLPSVRVLTETRKRKLAATVRQHGLSVWLEALAKIEASSFCTGGNDRGWRADLDFLLQPSSFAAILEGRYDNRQGKRREPPPKRGESATDIWRDDLIERGILRDEPDSPQSNVFDAGYGGGHFESNVHPLRLAFSGSK
ncbi:DNA replication protein [Falsochrobactrum shanghaiense]|uniref:DNA replication protein n=1 Tax=Falsochrobactrum shanghaiense TaxID=2201899 RepID=UPI0011B27D55|nr:DNA replication protein [Falsochrobactrum shanghaiense]